MLGFCPVNTWLAWFHRPSDGTLPTSVCHCTLLLPLPPCQLWCWRRGARFLWYDGSTAQGTISWKPLYKLHAMCLPKWQDSWVMKRETCWIKLLKIVKLEEVLFCFLVWFKGHILQVIPIHYQPFFCCRWSSFWGMSRTRSPLWPGQCELWTSSPTWTWLPSNPTAALLSSSADWRLVPALIWCHFEPPPPALLGQSATFTHPLFHLS